jgi:hypothetical protein
MLNLLVLRYKKFYEIKVVRELMHGLNSKFCKFAAPNA